jgi:enoyl-CoA hydratase/carnithine racemase
MNYSRYKHLQIARHEDILTITLNRPERRNSVNAGMHTEFSTIFTDVRADSAKAIVITGAGDWFSDNGDPDWLPDEEEWLRIVREGRWMIHDAMSVPQPIVIALNGNAMGFGCSVVALGDIVIAASGSRLGDHHISSGVAAGDGGVAFFPLTMGVMQAKRMYLLEQELTAEELFEAGVIERVVPRSEILNAAYEVANRLAAMPTSSLQWTKWSLNRILQFSVMLSVDGAFAHEGWSRHLAAARAQRS